MTIRDTRAHSVPRFARSSEPSSLPRCRRLWRCPPAALPVLSLAVLSLAALLVAPPKAWSQERRNPSPAREERNPSIRTENGKVVLERSSEPSSASQRRREIEAWLAFWRREIEPVREAAERILQAIGHEHPSAIPAVCRALGRAVLDVDQEALWPAPDYAVHRHLRRHLDHLVRAATACLSGRLTAVQAELRRAERARGQAALALKRYRG